MDVWAKVLSAVAKRVGRQAHDTWFRPIVFAGRDQTTLRVRVPNEVFRMGLLDNYAAVLNESVLEATGKPLQLVVSVEAPAPTSPAPSQSLEPAASPFALNPKYTFDSFVVGASNQFACAAARAVAERPSKAYNPLYIYGGVGLGKTHLMHAIGHAIVERNPHVHLTYMSSERFMNELVNAIRYDRTMQFRQKYRNIDVLLMDDIQFIAKWERTQEEFFHTFNALYDVQKQIVITSDCPPRDISTLEERLHSRFQWGLIADIQQPDLETKVAILKRKAEVLLPGIDDSVALFLAGSIRSSIRELEGSLTRLSALASMHGIAPADIDVAYARDVLRDVVTDERRSVTPEMIVQAVCTQFGLTSSQLRSRNNARAISQPRQIAMFVCKQLTPLSLPQIGREFGGKHHTTVLHSIRKIESMRKKDSGISSALAKILQSFN